MSDTSTLQVVVDATPAVSGAAKVEAAIKSMVSGANTSITTLSGSFDRMNSFLSKSNAGITSFFAALGAGYVVKSFIDRMIEVNTTFNAFIATMNVITGSIPKSQAEFKYLSEFADSLGVSIESIIKQYGRLAASMKAFDKDGTVTRHIFEALSEASSVLHLKGYETNLLFMALEQSASKGKVSLEEFQRQLANKLPDAMGLASRAMGMTQAEFRKNVTSGSMDVYEVLIKLSNQIKKEYGDAATYASQQFTGQLNRMHNSITQLYIAIGQTGAMDGLTKIVKSISNVLNDPSVGKAFGESLNTLFSQIAGWISSLTADDVNAFFLGLSGTVHAFSIILEAVVKAFSDTVDGKADFLSFGEAVAKSMIVLADAAMTFVAALMAVPLAANAAMKDVGVVFSGLKGLSIVSTGGSLDDAVAGINKATAERDAALRQSDLNLEILLGGDNSPTAKAWKRTEELFVKLREAKNKFVAAEPAAKGSSGAPLSDETIAGMLGGTPGVEPNVDKGIATAFRSEQLRLTKSINVSVLEYNNIMADRSKIEGKNRTELEAKLAVEKNLMALDSGKKSQLRAMADAADAFMAKRVAAESYQTDMLKLNVDLYAAEMDLKDVAEDRNPIENKNLRVFEEKLKFDTKYLAMSPEMIANERNRAKALDQVSVSLDNARKAQTSHNAALMASLDTQRLMSQLTQSGSGSMYSAKDKMGDSFKKGGANQFMDAAGRSSMMNDAGSIDSGARAVDATKMIADQQTELNQAKFELEMQGKSAEYVRRTTEARKIELSIKKLSVGATGDELKAYQNLEKFLKGQMSKSLDTMYSKQSETTNSLTDGLNQYLDSIRDISKSASAAVSTSFAGLTDGIASSVSASLIHGASLEDGLKNVAANVAEAFITSFIKIQIQKLLIDKVGQSAFAMTIGAESQAMVAMAGLNAFASAAAIPMVGWAMAPEAAAAAVAIAEGFAVSATAAAALSVAGGRALGGPVSAGNLYQVNENGPEMLTTGGRDYLMMGSAGGTVTPNDKLGGGGGGNITIINQTSSKIGPVTEKRASNGDRAIIIRDAVSAVAAQMSDPNSQVSKSMGRSFSVQRSR